MFRFMYPQTATTVFDLALGGKDLAAAFKEFADFWWSDTAPGAYAVFHNAALVARVLAEYDEETGRLRPVLQEWPQPTTESNRFACGD